jgi:hypothetical protein
MTFINLLPLMLQEHGFARESAPRPVAALASHIERRKFLATFGGEVALGRCAAMSTITESLGG